MVAVVVDDRDAIDLAHAGEAAVDAFEVGQCFADFRGLHAEMAGDGDSRQSVRDVVIAGHRQGAVVDRHAVGAARCRNGRCRVRNAS